MNIVFFQEECAHRDTMCIVIVKWQPVTEKEAKMEVQIETRADDSAVYRHSYKMSPYTGDDTDGIDGMRDELCRHIVELSRRAGARTFVHMCHAFMCGADSPSTATAVVDQKALDKIETVSQRPTVATFSQVRYQYAFA
jgi:hypothetical protein